MATRLSAEDVVDAAEQLLDREGIEALSARRLAAELGVSRQIVYTHFSGMHDVFEALHRRSGRHLAAAVEALTPTRGTDERILAAGQGYVDYARRHQWLFALAFGRPVPGYTPSEDTVEALRTVFRVHIVGLIDEWADANDQELGPAAAIERARIFWSSVHGLVTLESAGHATTEETNALVERLARTLIDGWRASCP